MTGSALPPPPPDYDPIAAETISSAVAALGAQISDWSEDAIRIRAEVPSLFLNRTGNLHGGAMMMLLDTAAGYAGIYCPYPNRLRRAVTLSFTTHFISGRSGGGLIAEGRVVGGGRRIFFAEASVQSEDGALLASGSGSFRYLGESGSLFGEPRSLTQGS